LSIRATIFSTVTFRANSGGTGVVVDRSNGRVENKICELLAECTRTSIDTNATICRTSLGNGERHYLRLILLHRTNVTSFEQLRTIDGHIFPDFRTTAMAMHLLDDDQEYHRCMCESAALDMPRAMRDMFATLLLFGPPVEPWQLFIEFVNVSSPPLVIIGRTCATTTYTRIAWPTSMFNTEVTNQCTMRHSL
jgi:hypothetical protein